MAASEAHAMRTGEQRIAYIDAWKPLNRTSILCEIGGVYELATSPVQRWFDALYTADARGTDLRSRPVIASYMRFFRRLRRKPDADWMALLVDIEGRDRPAAVGFAHRLECCQTGELVAYANEVPGFYWNNRGTLTLHVKRIA
jgi:hypothetical protein